MKNKEMTLCKHTDFNRNTHILSLQQSSTCTWVTWVNNLLLVEIRFPDNSYFGPGLDLSEMNILAKFHEDHIKTLPSEVYTWFL